VSDTFPLLLKEGKVIYYVSHLSPKLRLTAFALLAGKKHYYLCS